MVKIRKQERNGLFLAVKSTIRQILAASCEQFKGWQGFLVTWRAGMHHGKRLFACFLAADGFFGR